MHGLARRVSRERGEVTEACVCRCCGYELDRCDHDVMCDVDEFSWLGPGIPVYLDYFKFSLLLLLQFVIIVSVFDITSNVIWNPLWDGNIMLTSESTNVNVVYY